MTHEQREIHRKKRVLEHAERIGNVSADLNMSLPMIAKMLGHSQTVTTERYAHLADNPVQAAAEEVGKALSKRMNNSSDKGEKG